VCQYRLCHEKTRRDSVAHLAHILAGELGAFFVHIIFYSNILRNFVNTGIADACGELVTR
jgi:hypothetical protein